MTGTAVLRMEAARRRVAELEFSLRAYRGFPGAAAHVGAQLEAARLTLKELEGGR